MELGEFGSSLRAHNWSEVKVMLVTEEGLNKVKFVLLAAVTVSEVM